MTNCQLSLDFFDFQSFSSYLCLFLLHYFYTYFGNPQLFFFIIFSLFSQNLTFSTEKICMKTIAQKTEIFCLGSMGPPPGSKRPADTRGPMPPSSKSSKKKKKLADKILPQKVRELVPESQAYMDLLAFERKLDSTIMRKRLDIQEALKRPMKQKRKLRIFISNTSFPAREGEGEEGSVASWELRVEGRLIDDDKRVDPAKTKRKFSSFFKSLVIELDKDLYGPDNHLVEWHRTPTTQETDGFQVG